MKKLLAPLVALAVGFASISAFAADAPAKASTDVQKTDKAPTKKAKKARRTAKKTNSAKVQKQDQAAPQTTK